MDSSSIKKLTPAARTKRVTALLKALFALAQKASALDACKLLPVDALAGVLPVIYAAASPDRVISIHNAEAPSSASVCAVAHGLDALCVSIRDECASSKLEGDRIELLTLLTSSIVEEKEKSVGRKRSPDVGSSSSSGGITLRPQISPALLLGLRSIFSFVVGDGATEPSIRAYALFCNLLVDCGPQQLLDLTLDGGDVCDSISRSLNGAAAYGAMCAFALAVGRFSDVVAAAAALWKSTESGNNAAVAVPQNLVDIVARARRELLGSGSATTMGSFGLLNGGGSRVTVIAPIQHVRLTLTEGLLQPSSNAGDVTINPVPADEAASSRAQQPQLLSPVTDGAHVYVFVPSRRLIVKIGTGFRGTKSGVIAASRDVGCAEGDDVQLTIVRGGSLLVCVTARYESFEGSSRTSVLHWSTSELSDVDGGSLILPYHGGRLLDEGEDESLSSVILPDEIGDEGPSSTHYRLLPRALRPSRRLKEVEAEHETTPSSASSAVTAVSHAYHSYGGDTARADFIMFAPAPGDADDASVLLLRRPNRRRDGVDYAYGRVPLQRYHSPTAVAEPPLMGDPGAACVLLRRTTRYPDGVDFDSKRPLGSTKLELVRLELDSSSTTTSGSADYSAPTRKDTGPSRRRLRPAANDPVTIFVHPAEWEGYHTLRLSVFSPPVSSEQQSPTLLPRESLRLPSLHEVEVRTPAALSPRQRSTPSLPASGVSTGALSLTADLCPDVSGLLPVLITSDGSTTAMLTVDGRTWYRGSGAVFNAPASLHSWALIPGVTEPVTHIAMSVGAGHAIIVTRSGLALGGGRCGEGQLGAGVVRGVGPQPAKAALLSAAASQRLDRVRPLVLADAAPAKAAKSKRQRSSSATAPSDEISPPAHVIVHACVQGNRTVLLTDTGAVLAAGDESNGEFGWQSSQSGSLLLPGILSTLRSMRRDAHAAAGALPSDYALALPISGGGGVRKKSFTQVKLPSAPERTSTPANTVKSEVARALSAASAAPAAATADHTLPQPRPTGSSNVNDRISTSPHPRLVSDSDDADVAPAVPVMTALGESHLVILMSNGSVLTSGDNSRGQTGAGAAGAASNASAPSSSLFRPAHVRLSSGTPATPSPISRAANTQPVFNAVSVACTARGTLILCADGCVLAAGDCIPHDDDEHSRVFRRVKLPPPIQSATTTITTTTASSRLGMDISASSGLPEPVDLSPTTAGFAVGISASVSLAVVTMADGTVYTWKVRDARADDLIDGAFAEAEKKRMTFTSNGSSDSDEVEVDNFKFISSSSSIRHNYNEVEVSPADVDDIFNFGSRRTSGSAAGAARRSTEPKLKLDPLQSAVPDKLKSVPLQAADLGDMAADRRFHNDAAQPCTLITRLRMLPRMRSTPARLLTPRPSFSLSSLAEVDDEETARTDFALAFAVGDVVFCMPRPAPLPSSALRSASLLVSYGTIALMTPVPRYTDDGSTSATAAAAVTRRDTDGGHPASMHGARMGNRKAAADTKVNSHLLRALSLSGGPQIATSIIARSDAAPSDVAGPTIDAPSINFNLRSKQGPSSASTASLCASTPPSFVFDAVHGSCWSVALSNTGILLERFHACLSAAIEAYTYPPQNRDLPRLSPLAIIASILEHPSYALPLLGPQWDPQQRQQPSTSTCAQPQLSPCSASPSSLAVLLLAAAEALALCRLSNQQNGAQSPSSKLSTTGPERDADEESVSRMINQLMAGGVSSSPRPSTVPVAQRGPGILPRLLDYNAQPSASAAASAAANGPSMSTPDSSAAVTSSSAPMHSLIRFDGVGVQLGWGIGGEDSIVICA